ncbi:TPA: hypothetical protein IAC10_06850 [Candidatus Scatousia excrementigallinarum]|uniref:Uncharacterized protein n=1 Tax=Candidatus Scatousia excrementigallinarum TaxID=2840935 RepID=A0A9D1EZ14_9BACT|nr:hypothetical protein [Candidatus Scatousia excrementigallinarum]
MKDLPNNKLILPDLEVLNNAKTFQGILDDIANVEITPVSEIITEQLKPIIDKEEKVIEVLTDKYNKLNELYKIKEKELEDTKKDNKIMKCVSVISAVIAFLSLIATILVSAL